ncbi:MAG: hypothetical protein AAGD25_41405 [Cyanobacteria bacterium P01_F01_bin.150]
MTQLQFLTPEQVAQIPEVQKKWRQVYLNTQPIDETEAIAAIQTAYRVMGKKIPKEIVFQSSPRAALDYLQPYIQEQSTSAVGVNTPSRPGFFAIAVKALWQIIKRRYQYQSAGIKPLYDLLKQLSGSAYKPLSKHIDRTLPKDLSTEDIVEQGFAGVAPMFSQFGKQIDDPQLSRFADLQEKTADKQRQESFNMTASALDQQLGYLPRARLFMRKLKLKKYGQFLPPGICEQSAKQFNMPTNRWLNPDFQYLKYSGKLTYQIHVTLASKSSSCISIVSWGRSLLIIFGPLSYCQQ